MAVRSKRWRQSIDNKENISAWSDDSEAEKGEKQEIKKAARAHCVIPPGKLSSTIMERLTANMIVNDSWDQCTELSSTIMTV